MEDYPPRSRSRVQRSRLWLSLWMGVAAAAIAIGTIPHGSFVPAGLVVLVLLAVYLVVFVVRLRRVPREHD